MGLNAAWLGNGEWGILKSLPKLKHLSVWHGHGVSSLADFSGLNLESLTSGGCMGLRDKNRDSPLKQRDIITQEKRSRRRQTVAGGCGPRFGETVWQFTQSLASAATIQLGLL